MQNTTFRSHNIWYGWINLILLVVILSGCGAPLPLPILDLESPTPDKNATTLPFKLPTLTAPPKSAPVPTSTPLPGFQFQVSELKGTKVQFWYPWTSEMSTLLKQFAGDFNRNNLWGIIIEPFPIGGAGLLFDQVNISLKEKQPPHLVLTLSEQISAWNETKVIADLTPYLTHPEWGLRSSEITDFPSIYWEYSQSAKTQVTIPVLRTQDVLFYNLTWAKELGFTAPPRTPEEFKKQVCAAAKQNNASDRSEYKGTGGWISSIDSHAVLSWLAAFGATPLPSPSKMEYRFDTPEGMRAFRFIREMLDQGCAWNSRISSPYDYFARRQALFYSGTTQDYPAQLRAQQRASSKDDWVMLPYPAVEKSSVVSSLYGYAVLQSTPAQQLASWLFLRFLLQPERQSQLLQASSMQPVSRSHQESINPIRKKTSMWTPVLSSEEQILLTPNLSSWRLVRRILEDAAWQTYQTYTKPEDLAGILAALDQQINEVLSKKP